MAEYVERDALLRKIKRYGLSDGSVLGKHSGAAEELILEVELFPSADVAPVRWGRWIVEKNTFPGLNLENNVCSECGECAGTWPKRLGPRDKYAFCPWCGAKMEMPNDD